MKFDYTYVPFGSFLVFEPLIIVSNFIMLVLALVFFVRLRRANTLYARKMGTFMLMLGISGVFGAVCHSVHYQMGEDFFGLMFFLMNAFSLLSIFFCFWGTFIHAALHRRVAQGAIWLAVVWVGTLLVYSYVKGHFLLIKIHAGIVLLYTLYVHWRAYRRAAERGSLLIVWGIAASFISIIVHSAHISLHEWFNYKDLAHLFMIVALIVIYKGVKLNSGEHTEAAGTVIS